MQDGKIKIQVGGGSVQSIFHDITSLSNLLRAWKEFKRGKASKIDIVEFEFHLEDNLFALHHELVEKNYKPEPYHAFFVYDPKRRHIHKASMRDRVLHQAIFRVLYPIFNKHFIFDSFSSRIGKGTHAGSKRLFAALRKASKNWRHSVFALKCDVRKFFDSIDHGILRALIERKIQDPETLRLLEQVIGSFKMCITSRRPFQSDTGLPLGNVTSQFFANIYLNELDQFAKHVLKTKFYFRYADDFIIVHRDKEFLEKCLGRIKIFLESELKLQLHPDKVSIRKLRQGIDFVGYVILPSAAVLRTKTKKRILKKWQKAKEEMHAGEITEENFNQTKVSYMGVLKHCKSNKIKRKIAKIQTSC